MVLRIGSVTVGKSGRIAAQFPIPAQLLAYVANGSFDQIDVSRTADAAYKAEVAQAKKQKRLPALHRHRRPARQDHRPVVGAVTKTSE